MRIYLAAKYSRRLELCGYREQLREHGHTVDAVWLNGEHQLGDAGSPIWKHVEALVENKNPCPVSYPHLPHDYCDGNPGAMSIGERLHPDEQSDWAVALRQKLAKDDFDDVLKCELLIAFTEPPRSEGGSRGGRHVELGLALGTMKMVWIVGPRENLFCCMERVRQFDSWPLCLAKLCVP